MSFRSLSSLTCAVALAAGSSAYAAGAQTTPPPQTQPSSTSPQTTQPSGTHSGSGTHTGTKSHSTSAKTADGMPSFVRDAAQGGQAEVALGRLASDKASDPDVKQFGQMMVQDHSKANDELSSLASTKNWTLPKQPSAEQKRDEDRLSKLSGAQFDKAYMALMVKDHEKDVREFERESKTASDSDLKEWASKTVPTLRHHLEQAQSVNAKIGGGAKSTKSTTGSKPTGHKSTGKGSGQ
jgi:putative membrane protein